MDYEVERLVFVVRSVADGVDKGFKAAEKAASSMADVYAKAEKTELQLEKALKRLRQELDQAQKAGQKDTSVIEGKIARLEQTKASLQDYVEEERKRTDAIEESARAEAKSAKQQQQSQAQMLATIAVVGVIIKSYKTLKAALDETTGAYVKNRNAMVGLRSIAEGTGQSMGTINKAVQKLTSDGLIPLEQASTSLKNLLARGFEAQEAIDIILRLKDAAAFGRQASYSLADAVMTATEGLKNENSILVDNAGVTKNVSKMWLDYAKARGITTEAMTLAQKREAEYIGIMEETRHQVGDAKKLSEEFSGSQLALEASTQRLKVAIGEANATGLKPMLSALNELTGSAADFATKNQGLVTFGVNFGKALLIGGAALLVFRGGLKKMIAEMAAASPVVGALTTQIGTLKGVISGPWGWITLGISALVGIITAVSGESAKAAERLRELNEEAEELTRQAHGAGSLVDRYEELANKAFRTKEETAEMNRISSQLVSSYGFRADGIDKEGQLILTNVKLMRKQLKIAQDLARLKLEAAEKGVQGWYKELLTDIKDDQDKVADLTTQLENAKVAVAEFKATLATLDDANDASMWNATKENLDEWSRAVEQLESKLNQSQQSISKTMQDIFRVVGFSINLAKVRLGEEAAEIPQEMFSAMTERMQEIANEGGDISAGVAESMLRSFLVIDKEAAVAEGIAELEDIRTQIIAGIAASGMEATEGISIVNELMGALSSDSQLSEIMTKSKQLGQKIVQGIASADEKMAFNTLSGKIMTGLSGLQKDIEKKFKSMKLPTDAIETAFESLRKTFGRTAVDLEKIRDATTKATDLKDLIDMLGAAQSAYESLNKEIQDAYDLQAAIDVLREGDTATREFAQALDFMTDRYGASKDQILENLDAYQSDVDAKNVMIQMNYALAQAQILMAINSLQSMSSMDENVSKHSQNVINSLQGILDKLAQLDGASASLVIGDTTQSIEVNIPRGGSRTPSWLKPAKTKRSGGGRRKSPKRSGGSKRATATKATKSQQYKNEALERELELIERKKRLDQLTFDEEIALLERARRLYAKKADEREKIDDQLYALRREKETAHVEHLKAMDKLTLADEIKILEKRLASYKVGTEAYKEVERELYQARQDQVQRAYDLDIYYGRLTLEQQRERIKAMIRQYKKGTEARIELEKQLYEVQQQIKERDTQNLQKLADGVTTALRTRYEAQRQAEQEHIQKSMNNWQEWSEAQRAVIDEQIKALDELTKGEDRAEEERKRRRKIAALEQQLQYENDVYNQRKLREQIAKEQADLEKWLTRNEREDAKELLRQQADEISKRAEAEQKTLQQQLDNLDKFYEDRLKEHKLTAEAEQLLMAGNQKDIIKLIQSFAPEYDAVGKSLGERLYEGFASKAMNINTWFESMTSQIESYQLMMAQEANRAAVAFWQTHGMPMPAATPKDPGRPESSLPPIVINYYSERESPVTLSNELERMLERLTRR